MKLPLEPHLRVEPLGQRRAALKRAFDLAVALLMLPVLLPLTLILMVFAKISTGSALFTQTRVGRFGEPIQVIKLCSMRSDVPAATHVTTSADPRITSFGRFIRRAKFDEFPQIWNVIRGDMSFVGPRPDMPEMFADLPESDAPVLCLRPGITGPASIAFSDEEMQLGAVEDPEHHNMSVIFPQKVAINHHYIEDQSVLTDVRLMFATVFKVAR